MSHSCNIFGDDIFQVLKRWPCLVRALQSKFKQYDKNLKKIDENFRPGELETMSHYCNTFCDGMSRAPDRYPWSLVTFKAQTQ